MDKNYTQVPNDILEALYLRRLSPLQFQIVLYVIRKTHGFGGKAYDSIAVSKMAKDLGRYRQNVSAAVSDLEKMNILEVIRTRSKTGNKMRLKPSFEWGQPVVKTRHEAKSRHEVKTRRQVSQKQDAKRRENTTHKRNSTKETITKETPYIPHAENGEENARIIYGPFSEAYTEEELKKLAEEGWE